MFIDFFEKTFGESLGHLMFFLRMHPVQLVLLPSYSCFPVESIGNVSLAVVLCHALSARSDHHK